MKLIVWDWDNTLANTQDALHKTYLELLKRRNDLRTWTQKDTAIQMNYLSKDALLNFLPNENQKKLEQEFMQLFIEFEKDIPLLPYAREILSWTQQHKFTNMIASHRPIDTLNNMINRFKLASYFDRIQGDTFGDKTSLQYAQKILALYPQAKKIYVIGDGISDMQLGTHLKAIRIRIVYPFSPTLDDSIKVDYEIPALSELKNIIT